MNSPLVVPAAITAGAIAGGAIGAALKRDAGHYSGLRSHLAGFLIVVGAGIGFISVANLTPPRRSPVRQAEPTPRSTR